MITNLISAIPYIGQPILEWVWGGFSVADATLRRFFVVHFLLPFLMAVLSVLHIFFLHKTGSSNPLGVSTDVSAVPFHPYYTVKDVVGLVGALMMLSAVVFFSPNLFMAPENFIPANPLVTPTHIMPE